MAEQRPIIYVIGGPNGAGKTTFACEFLPSANVFEFLNVDLLATGLSPIKPEVMMIRASRLLLTRWKDLVANGRSFAFESTLSGKTYALMLKQAKSAGFEVRICYLWLPSVNLSIKRVRERVKKGGHSVPETDLRRRYLPSLRNFFSLYLPLSDQALLLNAVAMPPEIIASWIGQARDTLQPSLYAQIEAQSKSVE